MWGYPFCLLYFALAIVIIEANDRDIIKNIKKLREYAVLTQSVDFIEITEDYTEFESKLSKREKVLKTEPGQLQAVVDPTNVEFNRDFDRGMFLEKLLVVFFRSLCAINYYCMYLTTYFRLYQYVSESRQNII